MNKDKLSTRKLLIEFGFKPGSNVAGFPGLVLQLGDFVLSATWAMNLSCVNVVALRGVWSTGREVGEVDFEIPPQMTSRAQCAAYLVWGLNQNSRHLIAESHIQYDWFELGKNNQHELPWIREQAAYDARPQCLVERRWLRLALNTLSESLQVVQDDECVVFSFRDQMLLIKCGEQVIPSPGSGEPWPEDILIKAAYLRKLPKRLMRDPVLIDRWKGHLGVSGWGYPIYKALS